VRRQVRFGSLDTWQTADGLLKSECFPGFWLDQQALLTGNEKRVWDVLLQGVASPEHTAFVAELQKRVSQKP
jgi:hypothetical protein